jgi:hypothetical protein
MSRYKSIDSFVILGRVDPLMVLAHHDSEDDSTHRTRRLAPSPEIVFLMDRSYLDELVGVVVYLSLLVRVLAVGTSIPTISSQCIGQDIVLPYNLLNNPTTVENRQQRSTSYG